MDDARPKTACAEGEARHTSEPRAQRGGGTADLGNALDTLRVVGTFLVLMFHAALSYLASPMRLTLWHAYDSRGHVSMDLFAYWGNGFAMPLFFLAAGVSAPAAIESRGVRVFLKHRAGRFLRPLLFGCLTIMPVCYIISAYGLLVTGRCTANEILTWRFRPVLQRHLYGLGHLWFLEYLFVVCALWAGCWLLGRTLTRFAGGSKDGRGRDWLEQIFGSRWRPLLLAVPTALIFLADTDTVIRIENILLPNPSRVIHYLYCFAVGGWISRLRAPKERLIPHSRLYLVLAPVVFAAMAPLLLRFVAAPIAGWERVVFVGLAAVFPWLTILGGLGVCLEFIKGKGPAMRFLAEASFWVYLIHLPIVMLMQVLLLPIPWPGPVKFLVTSAVGATLSVLSYEYVTRYSLVGEIVNGARRRFRGKRRLGREFGWVAALGTVALVLGGSTWYLRVFLWQDNLHVVVPGQIYRCARISPAALDRLIRREGLRSVITFSGEGNRHLWIAEQKTYCQTRGVSYRTVSLRDDRLPAREQVQQLLALLEECPKPIVVQGYRGLDHCGFASALALLLGGTSPEEALDQFGLRYAQFGGPEHSILGIPLLDYADWLKAGHLEHTPERLKNWTDREYLVRSSPALPAGSQSRPRALAGVPRRSVAR
jgi:peptidoglycan/LPS O-acetylase OafA/YrhL